MSRKPNGNSESHAMRDYAEELAERKARIEQNPSEMSGEGAAAPADVLADKEADTLAVNAAAESAEYEADLVDEWLVDPEGVRVDRAIFPALALPVARADAVDWINKNVVSQGRGASLAVARVVGQALASEPKQTEHQGKLLKSIMLSGVFRMQSLLTGEIHENGELYLPLQYARQIDAALRLGGRQIAFDVTLGIEATGRTIPYAWTVRSHLRRKPSSGFERLWNARKTGEAVLIGGPAA